MTLYSVIFFLKTMLLPLSHSVMPTLRPHGLEPAGSSVHGDSPGQNTGISCHAFLQGIFPTQELNSGLPHCRQILYHLSHQGSPRILKWVAHSFSGGSFRPRNQTRDSCLESRFFTSCATKETPQNP